MTRCWCCDADLEGPDDCPMCPDCTMTQHPTIHNDVQEIFCETHRESMEVGP